MRNTQIFQVPFNDDDRFDTPRIDTTRTSDDFDTFSFDNISEERDGYKAIHDEKETSNDDSGIFSKSRDDASESIITNNQADLIGLPNDTKKHDNNMSPGARLRKAREQKNLSIQEIADQLFLEVQIVEKLEANNYDSLAQPIFVRGYMRNYAKLVGIPEESFLKDFDNMNQGQETRSTKHIRPTETVTNYHELLPKIGIVVLVILIVLIASLKFFSNTNVEDTTPAIAEVQQPDSNESLTRHPNDFQASETREEVQEGDEVSEEIRSDNPSESTVAMLDQTTAVADDVATPTTTEEETVIDVPLTPTKESLRVHLKEEVWMEIRDSSDKKLFSRLAQAGDVLNFEGKPPFYLKTARYGLDIEYKGETKGIKSYPKTLRDGKRVFVIGSDE
ncbi:hypothetical protein THIOM_005409 [Candidatus Thiomargarita nelsonii]|uniref:Cytoskeleton protein RodZ-like C-terminal domain-containing protein n=1 Tax=Candidatus Thiomargarita nelsonii TaxID=1003181 RepID=A0A176RTD5_9GAMM|nr:hypothetical protein THIOM_005409 [Candidatus Thiomargarita nelsonii]